MSALGITAQDVMTAFAREHLQLPGGFLVEGMLKVEKGGEAVRWLTPRKVIGRKLKSYFRKRDVFGPLGL